MNRGATPFVAALMLFGPVLGCTIDVRSTRAWTLSQSQPQRRDALWREDLRGLVRELPRLHKNAFFRQSRDEFERMAADLHERIPALRDHEVVVELMRLVSSLGDAHTRIEPSAILPPLRTYPFSLDWFSDGLFVTSVVEPHRDLLGAQLLRVGPRDIDAVVPLLATTFAHENEASIKNMVPRFLRFAEVLHTLRLVDDMERASFTFRLADGGESQVRFVPQDPRRKITWVRWQDTTGATVPLCERRPEKAYWFERVPPARLLYVKYNRCASVPEDPFGLFALRVLRDIDRGDVDQVVVDLRHNGGGNSLVAWPLLFGLRHRPAVNQRGKLFVVIGRRTFSSGQLNAYELRRDTHALLVGEPTGQKPNAYGEIRVLELPHSGIKVTYSTKYFETDPNNPPSMMPDIHVETSSADYRAGRDPVLEAILAYQPGEG